MFLAIINDTYAEVKSDVKNRKADFNMSDFFKTGANNMKGYLGIQDRGIDVENAIKIAAADDGFVTYDELRENLRKYVCTWNHKRFVLHKSNCEPTTYKRP